jgi:hypothetical protein
MLALNRSAIIVRPKLPFLDWLHAADLTSAALTLADLRASHRGTHRRRLGRATECRPSFWTLRARANASSASTSHSGGHRQPCGRRNVGRAEPWAILPRTDSWPEGG